MPESGPRGNPPCVNVSDFEVEGGLRRFKVRVLRAANALDDEGCTQAGGLVHGGTCEKGDLHARQVRGRLPN